MKKKLTLTLLALVCATTCAFGLAACDNSGDEPNTGHSHDYGTEWKTNGTHHWHECKNADCDAKEKDKAQHADHDGDGKCDTCEYAMSDDSQTGAIESITLNKTTLPLDIGESETLTVIYNPTTATDKTVTWSSSAPDIASVDNNGKVTALAEGKTTVTATTANNKTAECAVTVLDPTKPTAGLEYATDGNYAYVKGMGTATAKNIVIDTTYRGKTVNKIGEKAFAHKTQIKSITIPDSIKNIEKDAFLNLNLTSITYTGTMKKWCAVIGLDYLMGIGGSDRTLTIDGKTVTGELDLSGAGRISRYAFYGCDEITSLKISNTCDLIGEGAFIGCNKLTSVTVDSNNTVYKSAGNCIIDIKNKTLIFGLANCEIPTSGVKTIGAKAFSHCKMTSITIPENIEMIQPNAFEYCTELTSITIPNKVSTIQKRTFYYCSALTKITIPSSVTTICTESFYYCSKLNGITFEGTKEQWKNITKESKWKDSSVNINDGVTCTNGKLSSYEMLL